MRKKLFWWALLMFSLGFGVESIYAKNYLLAVVMAISLCMCIDVLVFIRSIEKLRDEEYGHDK